MAMFRLEIKSVGRSAGRTATSAAAYRAGERIRDERTGALYDHSRRADVLHKEIFLPSRLDQIDAAMEWARDRATLWNTAEKAEGRSNSRVAREYLVALPPELSPEQRLTLARAFSREVADRYNVAVDLAVHAPRPEGDPRNFHAHLLATTREVTPEGLGPKTGLDRRGEVRSELGLPKARQEFGNLRARWAELTNEALREANIEARVDHRSLEAQGIDREPRPRLPWAAIAAERRGERSEVAERIRERHRQRVAARREKAAARGADKPAERAGEPAATKTELAAMKPQPAALKPEPAAMKSEAAAVEPEPLREPAPPHDMDARRRQAVQNWLKYRAGLEQAGRHENEVSRPLSMEEIRQRAVAAWRSLRARGAESQPSTAGRQERTAERDSSAAEQQRDTPGLGDDFSG
jgi:MobA/MobL family protein